MFESLKKSLILSLAIYDGLIRVTTAAACRIFCIEDRLLQCGDGHFVWMKPTNPICVYKVAHSTEKVSLAIVCFK